MKRKSILTPLAVTIEDASLITGLSRRTIETAVSAGILQTINTGAEGSRKLLLVSDLVQLLIYAKQTGLTLNSDLSHMAMVKSQLDKEMR